MAQPTHFFLSINEIMTFENGKKLFVQATRINSFHKDS